MKLTFRTVFVLLSFLSGSCTSNQQQFVREPKNTKNEKWSCFIDGKQTSKQEAGSQIDAGIVDLIEFAPDSRSALLQYGEKYRYGIYIFVTNDKGKK